MTLADSVHRLTREHLTQDKDGNLRAVPALLAELRLAVTPGNSMSGGGASGAPSPINLGAVDMLAEMTKQARTEYREISGSAWPGELEPLLHHLIGMNLSAEWDAYLARVALEWVDSITAFLWPVKPRRKLVGKVCPSCGWAVYGEERKTCLSLGCWDAEGNMRKIGEWDIECASCEASWAGEQVTWLLRALETKDEDQEEVA